jgi:hypothetical protein
MGFRDATRSFDHFQRLALLLEVYKFRFLPPEIWLTDITCKGMKLKIVNEQTDCYLRNKSKFSTTSQFQFNVKDNAVNILRS